VRSLVVHPATLAAVTPFLNAAAHDEINYDFVDLKPLYGLTGCSRDTDRDAW